MTARDQLIEATADLLWERGYSATSPSMIMKRAGVGQGSMYHHFAGKADLAEAAMRRTAEQMRKSVLATERQDAPTVERIHAYLDAERDPLSGCRLGRLVQDPEVVATEPLRTAVGEFFAWLHAWLTQILITGQNTGELRDDFEPEQVATLIAATVQGGYVLARAEQNPALHQLAIDAAKSAVSALTQTRA
jgi:AcrR family transcriptional regulator